jgi:hypothetical protein
MISVVEGRSETMRTFSSYESSFTACDESLGSLLVTTMRIGEWKSQDRNMNESEVAST